MRRLGKDTIVIIEPGTKSAHGNDVDDWITPASEITVTGCYVELSVSAEDLVNRDATLAAGTAFAPAGTSCSHRAHVVHDGVTFAVDGNAFEMHSYSGALDHVPIPLQRWEG